MKKLIVYENGDRVIWNGRAEIHYHRTRIIKEHDITLATYNEVEHLKKNPNNDNLIAEIAKRK